MNIYYMQGFKNEIEKTAFNPLGLLRGGAKRASQKVEDIATGVIENIHHKPKVPVLINKNIPVPVQNNHALVPVNHGNNLPVPYNPPRGTPPPPPPPPKVPPTGNQPAATPNPEKKQGLIRKVWNKIPGPGRALIGGTVATGGLGVGGIGYGALTTPSDQPDPYERY